MKKLFVLSTLVLSALVGCAPQKGTGVATYVKGRVPIPQEATADGEYAIYEGMSGEPINTFNLHQGDPLGFKMEAGELKGIAGQVIIPLNPEKEYVWKRRSGQ